MVIHMGEDWYLLQECVDIDQPIVLPVIRQQADVGIIPDKIHPTIGRHHAAGVGEKQHEPYQAENQVSPKQRSSKLGLTQGYMVHH